MANKAREALSIVIGVESVIVDTTARMVLRTKDDAKPSEEDLNKALSRYRGMKLGKLQRVTLPSVAAEYQVKIKGMA